MSQTDLKLGGSPISDKAKLNGVLEQGVRWALWRSKLWKVMYYVEKSLLIVCSVLTSSDALNSLQKLKIPNLEGTTALFGLGVLTLTAFDVWLKPETKYKGYYQANDEYYELQQYVSIFLEEDNNEGIGQAYDEYKQINQRLRAIL